MPVDSGRRNSSFRTAESDDFFLMWLLLRPHTDTFYCNSSWSLIMWGLSHLWTRQRVSRESNWNNEITVENLTTQHDYTIIQKLKSLLYEKRTKKTTKWKKMITVQRNLIQCKLWLKIDACISFIYYFLT